MAVSSEKRRDLVIGWGGGSYGDRSVFHFFINCGKQLEHEFVKRRSQAKSVLDTQLYFSNFA